MFFMCLLGRSFYVIITKNGCFIPAKGSPNPFSIPSQGGIFGELFTMALGKVFTRTLRSISPFIQSVCYYTQRYWHPFWLINQERCKPNTTLTDSSVHLRWCGDQTWSQCCVFSELSVYMNPFNRACSIGWYINVSATAFKVWML